MKYNSIISIIKNNTLIIKSAFLFILIIFYNLQNNEWEIKKIKGSIDSFEVNINDLQLIFFDISDLIYTVLIVELINSVLSTLRLFTIIY